MAYPVYTIPAGGTLYHLFDTFAAATGAPITMSGFAVGDILVYKNGSTTQRSSTAGFTLLDTDGIDFDGITGIQGFSIDTSDNTDASFYTTGGWFHVVISAVTVDGVAMSFVACAFRIVAAEGVAGKPKVDVDAFGGTAGTFSSGRPEVNTTHISGTALSNVENSKSLLTMLRLMYSSLCCKVSGLGGTTVSFRDDADSKDRIVATVDSNGNRSAFATKDGT